MVPLYHRQKSGSQQDYVAKQQEESGELWGKGARPNGLPCAKAYLGPLGDNVLGVEFTTEVPPEETNHPFEARWYSSTPGVETRYIDGTDYAVVPIRVTRNTQC